ncbi:hypothetical protein HmCmsJML024_03566 [Escherichia coli]|nr:hypothetical protein HmCmsJML024_03566 [Escherichia coli]
MVLSRQELLRLMRLTEYVPDVKLELLNLLLSGQSLLGLSYQYFRPPWFYTLLHNFSSYCYLTNEI